MRVLALLLCCYCAAGVAPAADPEWFHKPMFFAMFDSYGKTVEATGIPFTGQAWAALTTAPGAEVATIREETLWHARSGPFFRLCIMSSYTEPPEPAALADSRMLTIDGELAQTYWTGASLPLSLYTLSSPGYQEYLRSSARRAVDAGADGLQVDDSISQVLFMFRGGSGRHVGTFDHWTMAAFSDYLSRKYTSLEFQSRYGIALASFNFADYVRTSGLQDTWNTRPLSGLSLEYFMFRRQETLDFLRDLIQTTKQYAHERYGRDFLFTSNAADNPIGYAVRDVMDMATTEMVYIRGMDHPFMALDIKASLGWKYPVAVLSEAMPSHMGASNPLRKATVNLERVIIADIQAAGGMPGATLQMNQGLQESTKVDLNVIRRYANFILGHPQLMSQTVSQARIGLLQGAAATLANTMATPGQPNAASGKAAYLGMARLLLDSGLTYNSVFLPDTTYSTLPLVTAADLARYSVVIAPFTFSLDDTQLASLLAFARQGGTLVLIGDFGTNYPDGSTAKHNELLPLMAKAGVTSYGSGRVVYTPTMYGVDYQNLTDNAARRQTRAAFQTFFTPYAKPDVQISGVTAKLNEPGIGPFFYREPGGNALVHLVNYDYNDATDSFYVKNNVTVATVVGTQAVDEVILRSPDIIGTQSLPFTRSGDTITVTVPQVEAWVVLTFQTNAKPPVIASTSPASSLDARSNATIPLSVQASDPDGNALTYTWAVNGVKIADSFGPNYNLQLPASSNSPYIVTVTVSDGSRTTQFTWTVKPHAYRLPRVLFDEAHNEALSIDLTRAAQLNPTNPAVRSLATLAQLLQADYSVSRSTGPITREALSAADVLLLAAPGTAFSATEMKLIADFVESGGALMYLGSVLANAAVIRPILDPYGIRFDGIWIRSSNLVGSCGSCFFLNRFAQHPAIPPHAAYQANIAGSLILSGSATPLAWTGATEWRSPSGQSTQQPGETSGPFVMIAAARSGRGRVIAMGDLGVQDDQMLWGVYDGNTELVRTALAWLAGPITTQPALTTANAPAITSVLNAASSTPDLSSGTWGTIFGRNLANTPAAGKAWEDGDFIGNYLPTQLAATGLSVFIDGRPTAVSYVSPTQVNFQVPDFTGTGPVAVQVDGPNGRADGTAALQPASPALFTYAAGGTTFAIAVGTDGRLIGSVPGTRSAVPGETLQLYATGFGETNPHQPAGRLIDPAPLTGAVSATVCGQSARVTYAGLVGAGLNQINLVLPSTATGSCAVQLTLGSQQTAAGLVLPIGF